jgi:hypothetical protein
MQKLRKCSTRRLVIGMDSIKEMREEIEKRSGEKWEDLSPDERFGWINLVASE